MAVIFNLLALGSVVLLGYLYWLGLAESYLFYYTWYDMPLHLLGGAVAGLWLMAVASQWRLGPRQALVLVLWAAAAIVLGWEVMEYATGLTGSEPDFVLDTCIDLVLGMAGALSAWGLYALLTRSNV